MKFKDFIVTVSTAQGTSLEYPPDPNVSANTVSTHIASRAGEQFSIVAQNDGIHDASCIFYVDGQLTSVLLCYARPKDNMVQCQGVQPAAGVLRRFVFSKATLTGKAGPTRVDVRRNRYRFKQGEC